MGIGAGVNEEDLKRAALEARLREIFSGPDFLPVLEAIDATGLKDWWLAGGAVRNTVWKALYGDDCELAIKDFDVAFFDPGADRETERVAREALTAKFPHLIFDVKNQASFGVWRDWHFIFTSCEDGIAHWLHTATAVGVRQRPGNPLEIFAPYGLDDLFDGVIRVTPANEGLPASDKKAQSFLEKCPRLKLASLMTACFLLMLGFSAMTGAFAPAMAEALKKAQVKSQDKSVKGVDESKIDRAIALVWQQPEVKAWLKNFRGKDMTSKLGGHASADAQPDSDSPGTDMYIVQVFEDLPDHSATFGWYQVNLKTGKVKKQPL